MRDRRAGLSLGELLITMTLITAVLPLSLQLIHRSLTASRRSQQDLQSVRTASQVGYLLRSDVHRALHAEWTGSEGSPPTLAFRMPGNESITYEAARHQLKRRRRLVAGTSHDEEFRFPESHQVQLSKVDAGQVQLTIWAAPIELGPRDAADGSSEARVVSQVIATVARNHRFAPSSHSTAGTDSHE